MPDQTHTPYAGTLFERMRRETLAPMPGTTNIQPSSIQPRPVVASGLVVLDGAEAVDRAIRIDRAEIDGRPAIAMQERGDDGAWHEIWTLPAGSAEAREGMLGWFNSQSHRWDRFARMLRRRGSEELTAWVFELMVVPAAANARAPRFEPQRTYATIDQYGHPVHDNCVCRPQGVQHSRHF